VYDFVRFLTVVPFPIRGKSKVHSPNATLRSALRALLSSCNSYLNLHEETDEALPPRSSGCGSFLHCPHV
jgi:hypothetical protein